MRWINSTLTVIVLLFIFGCEENDTGYNYHVKKDLYVSILNGDNKNIGTKESPFKNLTYALSQVTDTDNNDYTIYLDEGNYTQENGEKFPIEIPSNIKVKKREDVKNKPIIKGFGVYEKNSYYEKNITLILNYNTLLDSINVEGNISANSINIYTNNAIYMYGTNINISNVSSKRGKIGIYVAYAGSVVIDNCFVSYNFYGIKIDKRASVELKDTRITNNQIGVLLKGNSFISKGGNMIRFSSECDFIYDNVSNIHIDGILWDKNILHLETTHECIDGNDIVELNDGAVNYQVLLQENTPLFEEVKEIKIVNPSFGALVSSSKPYIEITPTKHKFLKIAIFKNRPIVENNQIINYENNVVWTWDTSMKKEKLKFVRYISFSEGRGYLNQGQHYYIAVWGWDDKGLKINLSSDISYFVVDNY